MRSTSAGASTRPGQAEYTCRKSGLGPGGSRIVAMRCTSRAMASPAERAVCSDWTSGFDPGMISNMHASVPGSILEIGTVVAPLCERTRRGTRNGSELSLRASRIRCSWRIRSIWPPLL